MFYTRTIQKYKWHKCLALIFIVKRFGRPAEKHVHVRKYATHEQNILLFISMDHFGNEPNFDWCNVKYVHLMKMSGPFPYSICAYW